MFFFFLSACLTWDIDLPLPSIWNLRHCYSGSQAFGLRLELHQNYTGTAPAVQSTTTPSLLGLQLADGTQWESCSSSWFSGETAYNNLYIVLLYQYMSQLYQLKQRQTQSLVPRALDLEVSGVRAGRSNEQQDPFHTEASCLWSSLPLGLKRTYSPDQYHLEVPETMLIFSSKILPLTQKL